MNHHLHCCGHQFLAFWMLRTLFLHLHYHHAGREYFVHRVLVAFPNHVVELELATEPHHYHVLVLMSLHGHDLLVFREDVLVRGQT